MYRCCLPCAQGWIPVPSFDGRPASLYPRSKVSAFGFRTESLRPRFCRKDSKDFSFHGSEYRKSRNQPCLAMTPKRMDGIWGTDFAESEVLPASSEEGWIARLFKDYSSDLMLVLGYGYWVQGFRVFPWLSLNFYLKDQLQVNPGTLQFLQHTVNLPMVAKPVYGIVSDAVYFRGAHRLPYIFVGGLLQAIAWASVASVPAVGSSLAILAGFLFLSNLGASIVEVATDALVAECGKRSGGRFAGQLQSFAWMAMSTGSLIGNLIAGLMLSRVDAKTMFLIFALLLGIQVMTSLQFKEESFGLSSIGKMNTVQRPPKQSKKCTLVPSLDSLVAMECKEASLSQSIRNQFTDIKRLLRKPEITFPLTWFAASYATTPMLSGIMFFYYTQHLRMEPSTLGLAKVVGQLSLLLGSYVYNRFLKNIPMRKLICSVQILLSICMLADIFLVKQINVQMGISNEAYVIAASAIVEAIAQFKILPFTVLLAQLCPVGCEGSLMASFMSVQCLSNILSGYLGVGLASALGVSSENYSRLPLGIFIQSMATLVPLFWISYVPGGNPSVKPALALAKRR